MSQMLMFVILLFVLASFAGAFDYKGKIESGWVSFPTGIEVQTAVIEGTLSCHNYDVISATDVNVSGNVTAGFGVIAATANISGAAAVGSLSSAGAIAGTTLDTGQGAGELYGMNQPVLTTSDVTFTDFHATRSTTTIATIGTANVTTSNVTTSNITTANITTGKFGSGATINFKGISCTAVLHVTTPGLYDVYYNTDTFKLYIATGATQCGFKASPTAYGATD